MPVVRVEGTAAERGRAAGAALAEPIHRSLAFYRGFLERRGARIGDLPRLLGPYREAAERALPALVAEVDGLAEGAEAPPWEVFAVNAFEELEPLLAPAAAAPLERCTAFAVTGAEGTLLAHNEQWYAGDSGNAAVIIQRPDDGIGFVSPTVVTCLPAVGLNSAGLAQGIMSLTARDDGVGIPRVLVSRCALRAADREDLIRRATIGGRAGGYAHLVAREGGEAFTVETSTTEHAVLEGPDGHTNHYLDPELADRGETSAGSTARLGRLRTLLAERDPRTPQDAMEVLRDHEGEPQAICLHPHPADGDEASSVLFSMVCHLEERRMWVAAGNPCTAPYEEIDIREVA